MADTNNLKFRPLRADEIEVRIAEVYDRSVRLLLYKDARCDRRILDETVGAMNWKCSYELIDGTLFCTVYIWDDTKKEWVGKSDCGVESKTEAEKGRASDAFKRACFAWGIGRELYTRANLRVTGVATEKKASGSGKPIYFLVDRYLRFFVDELEIDEQREKITHMTIINGKDEICAKYDERAIVPHKREVEDIPEPTYGRLPDGRVICLECQQEVKPTIGKSGQEVAPLDIVRATGGYCPACYRKLHSKQQQEAPAETTEE